MLSASRWYFANESDNLGSTVDATPGIQVTLGASNSDGSAVTLLSALGHDAHYLLIALYGNATQAGTNPCNSVDILQDPAGGTSWATLIDDFICASQIDSNPSNITHTSGLLLPLYIKSGTSIGIIGRTAHSSTRVLNVSCWAFGNPCRPDQWWCGSKVETLGATPAGSRGTTVTPGASGSFGSWTNIGGTTSGRYGCIQPSYTGINGTAAQVQSCKLQTGYGSTKLAGSPVWSISSDGSENINHSMNAFPFWCDIPAGTQMQAQIASDLGSPDNCEIALYGVY